MAVLLFSEILGHESLKQHFLNAREQNRISHAYMLSGETLSGKKSLANAFALSLLCEKQEKWPCLHCHSCKQVLSGNHPDLIYVTHEKTAGIGVDDVRRQVEETVAIRPYNSSYKIYMIDKSEKMTVQAQNALLKTMEEPPSYVVILLLTSNQERLLPTILSRCVQMKLTPLPDDVVRDYLVNQFSITKSKAEIYAAFARGNLGKAIDLTSSEVFQTMYQEVVELLKEMKRIDITQMMERIRSFKEYGMEIESCLDLMQIWYRDALIFKATKDGNLLILKEEFVTLNEKSNNCSYEGLELILQAIDKTRQRLLANVNMELALELLLLVMKEN